MGKLHDRIADALACDRCPRTPVTSVLVVSRHVTQLLCRSCTARVLDEFPRSRVLALAPAGDHPAVTLLKEAMHLRTHGERAPGGNETWRDWDLKTDEYLRSLPAPETSGNAREVGE